MISEPALTYLIYTRRSTDDMENQKNTVEYQSEQCRRFALNNYLELSTNTIDGFCDSGVIKEKHTAFKTSGIKIKNDGRVEYRIDRPKFQRLVSLLAKKQYRGVICLCWDRISRNPHDDAIIKNMLAEGIDIRFVQAQYDQSSSGALHMDIDGMFAAHYSRVCGEKIRAANAKLRNEGKINNAAPIGYLDQGPDNKPWDPERAPIVRQLFSAYATGEWSMAELAKWANQQGLTSKPRRKHRCATERLSDEERTDPAVSRPMTKKNIEKILHNPFYAGFISFQGELLSGHHKPLITKNLFYQVKEVLSNRDQRSLHHLNKAFYAYRGFFRCDCQRYYTPYNKKNHIYYSTPCFMPCNNQKRNLREELVDDVVLEIINKIVFTEKEVDELTERSPRTFFNTTKNQQASITTINQKINRLHQDLSYLEGNKIVLLRSNVYNPADYTNLIQQILREVKNLEKEKTELNNSDFPKMLNNLISTSELIKSAVLTYKRSSAKVKHHLATKVISELFIKDGILSNFTLNSLYKKLIKRHTVPCGGAQYLLSELPNIYVDIKNDIPDWKL